MALLSVDAVNGGYATLRQILALMLGANVGFTVTVQLLAFKFYLYNAIFIAIGVPLYLFSKRQNVLGAGQAVFGIGFLLLAIQVLSMAVAPIKNSADVLELIRVLENHPVWLVLLGILLQVATQSSTTTIGIGIALCWQEQVIHLGAALAIVIGANIGIGVTSLLARTCPRRYAAHGGGHFVCEVGGRGGGRVLAAGSHSMAGAAQFCRGDTRHAIDRQFPHRV